MQPAIKKYDKTKHTALRRSRSLASIRESSVESNQEMMDEEEWETIPQLSETVSPPLNSAASTENPYEKNAPESEEDDEDGMKKMFMEGRVLLDDTTKAWRKITQKLVTYHACLERGGLLRALQGPTGKVKGAAQSTNPEHCHHPPWAARYGANQHASYAHCMVCRTRLWIKRKPKDPKKSGSIKHQESQPYDPPKVTKAKKKAGPKNEKDCEKEITPPLAPDSASWMTGRARSRPSPR